MIEAYAKALRVFRQIYVPQEIEETQDRCMAKELLEYLEYRANEKDNLPVTAQDMWRGKITVFPDCKVKIYVNVFGHSHYTGWAEDAKEKFEAEGFTVEIEFAEPRQPLYKDDLQYRRK